MFSKLLSALLVPSLLFSTVAGAGAQVDLSSVGPSTALSAKSKICNVLDYGAVADNKTDIGPAISSAFTKCAKSGGATIYVPPGSYSINSGVVLNAGNSFALQIDGLITLTANGAFNGNAIVIENSKDVEVFSSNGLGAINGQGYITRLTKSSQNARLFRFVTCSEISIHDMIFIDSPTFHLIFNSVSNMETYHITIRGPDIGGTDGIDVTCTDNCYMHDIEVTNRDECISVKTPSNNILIEDIYCNHSGGMSIGSLSADGVTSSSPAAAVSNITMRNIYVYQCTQMLMIKTFPGGTGATGFVKDSLFENFWAYDTTYALDIDQYWESHTTPDTGAVALTGLTFNNWTGTMDNGASRGAIVIRGSDIVPAVDISLSEFNMWTQNGNKVINQCKNVYGTGYCARSATGGLANGAGLATFTTSVTSTVAPTGFVKPTSPAWAVSGYGTTVPIPVYTPAVMWSPVSNGVGSVSTSSGIKVVATSTPISSSKASSIKASSAGASSTKASSTKATVKASSTKLPSSLPLSSSSSLLSTTLLAVPTSISRSVIISPSTSALTASATSSAAASASAPTGGAGTVIQKYYQCGGTAWTGSGACVEGTVCTVQNAWYSQCL